MFWDTSLLWHQMVPYTSSQCILWSRQAKIKWSASTGSQYMLILKVRLLKHYKQMIKGTFSWNNSGLFLKPYSHQKSFFLSECKFILVSSLLKTLFQRIIRRWCFVWWGDKSHHRVVEMFCQQEMENYSTNGCRVSDKIFLSDPSSIIAMPCHSITKWSCWDLTSWIC